MSSEVGRPGPPVYPSGAPGRGETRDAPFGLPAVWLRHNCPCARCRDRGTGQRLIRINDVPPDVSVAAVRASGRRVEIEFGPDGHRAVFDAQWLAGWAAADSLRGVVRPRGDGGYGHGRVGDSDDGRAEHAKRLWSASEMTAGLPQGSWPLFGSDAAHRQACLTAVLRDGFVVLQGLPREHGAVLALASSISFVRETLWGRFADITGRPGVADLACSGRAIPACTAQAFRDPAPTVHLLHCLGTAAEGGETILVDGFNVASVLRDENPDAFAVLAGTTVTFAYADAKADLRATRPVIGVDPHGRVREIRYSDMSMQPVRLPATQIREFYAAYRAFAEIAGRRELTLTLRLRPGECLIADNTRILAGRTAFADSAHRHVQVCWADIDGIASSLALSQRPYRSGDTRG